MPLLRYQRYATYGAVVITLYEQSLSTFAIGGKIEFEFGTGPTWAAGTYSFLSYATADASVTQANLDLYARAAPPTGFTAGAPQLDTVNQRVTITLTAI
jgi:hypothetical protein